MSLDLLIALVVTVSSLVLGLLVFVLGTTRKMSGRIDYLSEDILTDILAVRTARVSISDEKKEAIQKMGPKTFYYIDESQVKDLYPQVFEELEPKRIQTREIKEVKKGIAAKLKLIEPKWEKGKAEEVTKDYDVKQTPAMMYNKVEEFLLDKGKVIFGLDEFEFEKSSIDDFESMCDQIKSKFSVDIPDSVRTTFVSDKMREFALQYCEKLASSSGYVALQSEFLVHHISDNDCILYREHPLNEYLRPEDGKVMIKIRCLKSSLTPSGSGTFEEDKSVKITSLGKVVSWNDKRVLEISPIAIY